jgi:hypothetical protein
VQIPLFFLNIHLRGKILTPPLLPNNHHHITNYPVGVVFGQYMTHWAMPKHIFNYPENPILFFFVEDKLKNNYNYFKLSIVSF